MKTKRKSAGRKARPFVVCRIGSDSLLAGPETALPGWLTDGARRQLRVIAGEHPCAVLQYPAAIDIGSLIELGITPAEGLAEFVVLLSLSEAEAGELLRGLYGFAAPMLGLRTDPVLLSTTRDLVVRSGEPHGLARLVAVDGHSETVVSLPPRLALADGDILLHAGESLTISHVQSIHQPLAETRSQAVNAIIDCAGPAVAGPWLAIGKHHIGLIEIRVERSADLATFHRERSGPEPEIVSLLALASDAAATELALNARRDRHDPVIDEPAIGFRFVVETGVSLDHGLFLAGWFQDPDHRIGSVIALDHSLTHCEISGTWKTFPGNIDIEGKLAPLTRFAAFLPRKNGLAAPFAVTLQVRLANGETHHISVESRGADLKGRRDLILGSIAGYAFDLEMLESVYQPALAPLARAIRSRQAIRQMESHGRKSRRLVSLVIPLYRETGFIRTQLMAFCIDPYIRRDVEIIYVVDDPSIVAEVRAELGGIQFLHPELDLRLVILSENCGYAPANNFGVSVAEGEIVVLMNSDVIPISPGWLESAAARLGNLPPMSVIGPKLLYADRTLQHAGLFFYALPNGQWQNMHYWKGYGARFEPANFEREVPGVTGACMIVRRQDYLAVGGFTEDYIVGDYEDSDLCLKLRASRGLCLYMPSIELHHFERQSMPKPSSEEMDRGSTIYNRTLHTARWSAAIAALQARLGLAPDA